MIYAIGVSIAVTIAILSYVVHLLVDAARSDEYDKIQRMFWGN